MAFPGNPPDAENGWIQRKIQAFFNWCVSRQPIPDPNDFKIDERNNGVYFGLKPVAIQKPPPGPYTREFDIRAVGDGSADIEVLDGTIMGKSPETPAPEAGTEKAFYRLTVADGDKVWIKLTRAGNNYASSAVENGAAVPADDLATQVTYYEIGSVTVDTVAGFSTVTAVNSRWGPLDVIPGSATSNYIMTTGADGTAQVDYWDLLESGRGKDTTGTALTPTYDSVQTLTMGLSRFVIDGDHLKIFVRPLTINSAGQITFIGTEELVFDQAVINP